MGALKIQIILLILYDFYGGPGGCAMCYATCAISLVPSRARADSANTVW